MSEKTESEELANEIAQEIAEEFEDVEVFIRSTTCISISFQCGIKI